MQNKTVYKNRLAFFLLFGFFFIDLCAQDTITSALVEQQSYQLYQDKKWNELVHFGNKAVKQGYDYFYLQMRIGIAYFEKKNYCEAEEHFKKALKFNSSDELALEYLYYCYLYNGRYEDAKMLSKQFSNDLASKIGINKQSSINYIMFEGGTKLTDKNSYVKEISGVSYTKAIDIKNIPVNNTNKISPAVYFQVGLSHSIKKRISFFHAFTYFNQTVSLDSAIQSQQLYQWDIHSPPSSPSSTTITIPYDSKSTITSSYKLQQLQYYLKASITCKNNWTISPAFDWINTRLIYNYQGTTSNQGFQSDPPTIKPGVVQLTIPMQPINYNTTFSITSNYYIGSLSIQKIIKKATISVGSTFSNVNSINQFIHFSSLYYSPLGNSMINIGGTGYLHTTDNYANTYVSVSPLIYIQPLKYLGIKVAYLYNKENNIIEDNGYFVNNSPDLTQYRWSVLTNFYISKSVTLYATYQIEHKLEKIQDFNYNYKIIVAGIKITPTNKLRKAEIKN